ncbi:hypothetical protein HW132_24605 [Brasilonema sp. CT11]|nr:hypothetical protein [Brasilonema sp. CT11]
MDTTVAEEQKVMNLVKLDQLQQEIQKAVYDGVESSKLGDVLEKYGLGDRLIQIHVKFDLDKIRSSDALKDPEIKDSLGAIPGREIVIAGCAICPGGHCC